MPRRILLPVDGSKHGRAASELAGSLASLYDSEVVLLHVLDPRRVTDEQVHMAEVEHRTSRRPEDLPWMANIPSELWAMLQPVDSRQTREETLRFLAEKVVKSATDVLERNGVPEDRIRVVFKNGDPVKRIMESIEEKDADMVVMGSRGLSDIAAMVLGSVSQRVSTLAPCTVVTARA